MVGGSGQTGTGSRRMEGSFQTAGVGGVSSQAPPMGNNVGGGTSQTDGRSSRVDSVGGTSGSGVGNPTPGLRPGSTAGTTAGAGAGITNNLNSSSTGQGDQELVRGMQAEVEGTNGPARMNISSIAKLLNHFDNSSEQWENWVKRLGFLRTSFDLNESMAKVLLTMRLKGRALDWMYSKPEYVDMAFDDLLAQLKAMLGHRMSKMAVKAKFEEYIHDKVILANAIPINDPEELLEYAIEGIPDPMLRNNAYVQRFQTLEALINAFQKVTLPEKRTATRGPAAGR